MAQSQVLPHDDVRQTPVVRRFASRPPTPEPGFQEWYEDIRHVTDILLNEANVDRRYNLAIGLLRRGQPDAILMWLLATTSERPVRHEVDRRVVGQIVRKGTETRAYALLVLLRNLFQAWDARGEAVTALDERIKTGRGQLDAPYLRSLLLKEQAVLVGEEQRLFPNRMHPVFDLLGSLSP